MESRRVTAVWGGRERDIVTILISPWPTGYGADPSEEDTRGVFYRMLDDEDEATGEIVGIEIDDFLDFDHRDEVPSLPNTWQLRDWEPLQLVDLLKQLQAALRAQVGTPAPALRG